MARIRPEEARHILMERAGRLRRIVHRPLAEAHGILAGGITAGAPLPRFTESAADGYAIAGSSPVRVFQWVGGFPLERDPGLTVEPGQAAAVTEGIPMPRGTDTVVPVEHCSIEGDWITVADFTAGQFVRKVGEDVAEGQAMAGAGTEVNSGLIGGLAALGIERIPILAPPRVGIAVAGNEGEGGMEGGRKSDAARAFLQHALRTEGVVPYFVLGRQEDPGFLSAMIASKARRIDLLLVIGGASRDGRGSAWGEVMRAGGIELFFEVAQRPGGFFGAAAVGDALVIGLPDNPAALFLDFYLFLYPMIRRILGHARPFLPDGHRRLAETHTGDPEDDLFLTGAMDGDDLRIFPAQESRWAGTLARTQAIVHMPPGPDPVPAGTEVEVFFLPGR